MFILLIKKNVCEYPADTDVKTIITVIIRFFIYQKNYGF